MRANFVASIRNLAHDMRIALGQQSARHYGALDAVAGKCFESAEHAATHSVLGPAACIQIRKTGFQRVTHRADAGPMVIRPCLECHPEKHRDTLAAGPTKILGQQSFRTAAVYAEWAAHFYFLRD